MTDQTILDLLRTTFGTALSLAGPLLAASIVVGLVISIAQVVTSIHDPTLSFVPRMVAIVIVALFLMSWMLSTISGFTTELLSGFTPYIQ